MTSCSRGPSIPGFAWLVILPDGTVVKPEQGRLTPTATLREAPAGTILAARNGGELVIAAPTQGRCTWLSTVDLPLDGSPARRYLAPGVEGVEGARAWIFGHTVVLTDGPVEVAFRALERVQAALREEAS